MRSRIDSMEHYSEWSEFRDVYLEDSFVLDIREGIKSIEFDMEIVLTETHSLYSDPPFGTQYCYRNGLIRFNRPARSDWQRSLLVPAVSADNSLDYGNIDNLSKLNNVYHLEGEWGKMSLAADSIELIFINSSV